MQNIIDHHKVKQDLISQLPYTFNDHLENVGIFLIKSDREIVRHLDGRRFWSSLQREQYNFPKSNDHKLMENIVKRTTVPVILKNDEEVS